MDNEHLCKQVLWLAPVPPACTPNYRRNNAIKYYKQESSSQSGYTLVLIPLTKTQ